MRRDIVDFIFEHLDWFQGFDNVPIYYDGGHPATTAAIHEAFDYALARNVAIYKELPHETKRLAQAAGYLCSIKLAETLTRGFLVTRFMRDSMRYRRRIQLNAPSDTSAWGS